MMAATIPPATSLNDPNLMFTEDIIADPGVAPQIFNDPRTPKLRIYSRAAGLGNPDIVTGRTEAYILSCEEADPSVWGRYSLQLGVREFRFPSAVGSESLAAERECMPPHDWVNNLDHESRLRARMTTDRKGQVVVFTLQLEFLIEDDWLPAIRYDSAHGEAHIDLIDPSGVQYDKIWLGQTPPYNVLFTLAEDELEEDAAEHRRRFLRQLKGGQK